VVFAGVEVGAGAIVGDQAYVRERATIGAASLIGRGTAVDNDVDVGARVKVQTNCYLAAGTVLLPPDQSLDEYRVDLRAGAITLPLVKGLEPLQVELQHFADCIQTGKKPLTDGVLGLRTVRLLKAAQASANNGGAATEVVN
jgi:predicted dehydrogenase